MSKQSFVLTVTHSRAVVARIASAVYDRGWDIHRLDYERNPDDARGVLRLTANGGAENLDRQLRNLVEVIHVDADP